MMKSSQPSEIHVKPSSVPAISEAQMICREKLSSPTTFVAKDINDSSYQCNKFRHDIPPTQPARKKNIQEVVQQVERRSTLSNVGRLS